ncbi:MAG: hypothetical protein AAFZ07_20160 [Actinomycetota bacterium]
MIGQGENRAADSVAGWAVRYGHVVACSVELNDLTARVELVLDVRLHDRPAVVDDDRVAADLLEDAGFTQQAELLRVMNSAFPPSNGDDDDGAPQQRGRDRSGTT